MEYSTVKFLHQGLVLLSILGFGSRWLGRLAGAAWTRRRAARTLPHVVDSALLLSGLWLAWAWGSALGAWFVAKMVGLVAYILLGAVSLRASQPLYVRLPAGLAALAIVAWMVSVAITKRPAGFLG